MINYSDLIILALIDRYDQRKWYHSNILQIQNIEQIGMQQNAKNSQTDNQTEDKVKNENSQHKTSNR